MTDCVRWGRKGRVLALAGSLVYSVCAFAQESDPNPEPDPQPPWLERVIQTLERVEAEQQALRQEIEALRARSDDSPESENVIDPTALFEAEQEAPVPEDPPEIQRIVEELARLEAEQQALRQEVEALLARRDEPQVQEMEHSAAESEPAVESEEDSTLPIELAEQDADVLIDAPDAEEETVSEATPDPEESETSAAMEEKVFSPQITQPAARLYGQGREAFRNLNFYDAAKAFREFLIKYPTHEDAGEARYWLGETLYVEGRFQEAIAAFAEVIADEANPRREVARLKTGYAWFELGDFEKAEAILTEVRDQNPGSDLARLAQLRLDRLQRRAGGE